MNVLQMKKKKKNYNSHFTQSVYRNRGETDSYLCFNHSSPLSLETNLSLKSLSQTIHRHLHSNISRIRLHICTVQIHFMQTQMSLLTFRLKISYAWPTSPINVQVCFLTQIFVEVHTVCNISNKLLPLPICRAEQVLNPSFCFFNCACNSTYITETTYI